MYCTTVFSRFSKVTCTHSLIVLVLFSAFPAKSQTNAVKEVRTPTAYESKVYGTVVDEESKQPLKGVVVTLLTNPSVPVLTNNVGYYEFLIMPLGRQSFSFSMVGFETFTATAVEVIAGKALELNVSLKENFRQLKEVVVKAEKNRMTPGNEFAAVSARSFSVDETRRYAASVADPARMALNFPGVSINGDNNNDIVVRGNSPKGVLWRLEGIEIPNPNHFSSLAGTGGTISMLNANMLGKSDFYTGAFVPEIGNALSGVFDLYIRNGNTDKYEHTLQIGTLGAELASEGPFKEGGKSSYLFSYRYSTFALIKNFVNLGETIPTYQDFSFKINLPTKKSGTFAVFGLGGITREEQVTVSDSSLWKDDNDNVSFNRKTSTGIVGLSHLYLLDSKSYIKSVVSASIEKTADDVDTLNPTNSYARKSIERTLFKNNAARVSVMYNRKINANHTYRTGIIVQRLGYDLGYGYYDRNDSMWTTALSGSGNTWFYQGYLQWKAKLSERLTATGGVHSSYYALNRKASFEPRATLNYVLNRSKLTIAAGWHSKPEHLSTYLFLNPGAGMSITHPGRSLDLLRAFHLIAGFDTRLFQNYRLKIEAYYQRIRNVPVEADTASGFSMLNADNLFSLIQVSKPLISLGRGVNYGVDLSIERSLNHNFYLIGNTSLFKSTYTNFSGESFDTKFNRSFQVNVIAGKEFKLARSGRSLIGVNGKILFAGGVRESVIDIDKSLQEDRTVYADGKYFTNQTPGYFRSDLSIYVKVNRKKSTHTVQFDVQNVTNRRNYGFTYFDRKKGTVNNTTLLGLVPNLCYRVDFHR